MTSLFEAQQQDQAVAGFVRGLHQHLDDWLDEYVLAQAGQFTVTVLKLGPPEGARGPVRLHLASDDGNGGVSINLDPETLCEWRFPSSPAPGTQGTP